MGSPLVSNEVDVHAIPSHPPVHSRLLPRPPHCRTVQYASVPRIHPLSPSPCLLPPQGSRVRSFGLAAPDHDSFAAVSPTRSCLVILHHIPFFSLHTHSTFPPINTRPRLYYCRSALRLKPLPPLVFSLPLAAASFNLYTLLSRQRGCCWCSDRGTWYRPSRGQQITTSPPTTATATALIARIHTPTRHRVPD